MTRDMTEGSALKHILTFTLPLLAGNLFQQFYNLVDAAIVGKYLGAQALAGVGATSSVQFLVLGFCIGTCSGFAIPIAQRFGAKDYDAMRQYIFHSGIATLLLAAVTTLPCVLFCNDILHLLRTPSDIYTDAYQYLVIIFLGIPFMLLYNLLSGILRAVGDSRTPFVFLAIAALLNILLDLLFIIRFGWGCAGAGIATVVSQAVSGILCFGFIILKVEILRIGKKNCVLNGKQFTLLITMGVPMGLQFSITAIGSMVMQGANNSLGSVYVSAFTTSTKLKQISMCPFDALATAVSTFASQNYGAGKIVRIKEGIIKGTLIGISYGLFIGLVLIFFGRTLSCIFIRANETAVLDASAFFLRCAGMFFWSLGILNVCRLTTQGLGFSAWAIFSGVTEMIARIIVSVFFVPKYSFVAISFADQAAWISACLYIVPVLMLCIKKISRGKDLVQA